MDLWLPRLAQRRSCFQLKALGFDLHAGDGGVGAEVLKGGGREFA
jgi:hypothetical protein